jgi:hypothetical protein
VDAPAKPAKPASTELSPKKDPVPAVSEKPVAYVPPPGTKVLRWTFKAVPSEMAMRKLHAVCVLAEGSTPLRVMSPKGDIMVPESEGVLVVPDQFLFLSDLFGL